MNLELLNILRCPKTNQRLKFESNFLVSQDKQNRYIVEAGIPRFVDENNYANAKFTTYSGLWIKGYMTKYIKQMYTNNHMLLNEEIVKTYDQDNIIISIFDLDILDSLERDIITKKYIRRPRVITSILASQYNKTSWDIAKINNKALTKLRRQYIIENNITYL